MSDESSYRAAMSASIEDWPLPPVREPLTRWQRFKAWLRLKVLGGEAV